MLTLHCVLYHCSDVALSVPLPTPQTPFFATTSERIIARVKAGNWSFKSPCWTEVSDLAKDLVRQLMQVGVNGQWGPLNAPLRALLWARFVGLSSLT